MKKPVQPTDKSSPWKAVGLVSAIGVELVLFTLLGFFFGRWMNDITGGSGLWIGLGVLIGLVAGAVGIVALVRKVLEGSNE
ncbi:AtpZ/AtpI family protein [Saccharibacillus sp. CPCC 101409]|uniref:AtpZ/AtpI family protein n=1 Tax=Saccharibacillus sp. CPCC 101409 TaxID=3058041 RepID=UPI002672FF7C|nr:AtpZ/AtpI family protein [Saccharibacillus sp. CPCC 101409]MDO3412120.1 AtpZ/AtpI family protein [Saccharibacillus sp. CPCC 101409]